MEYQPTVSGAGGSLGVDKVVASFFRKSNESIMDSKARPIDTPSSRETHSPDTTSMRSGARLYLLLTCPECKISGRVSLEKLSRMLRCPACHTSFWLGRDGQFHSDRSTPTIRVPCPRCQAVKECPEILSLRNFRCDVCKLEVSLPRLVASPSTPGNSTSLSIPPWLTGIAGGPAQRRLAMLAGIAILMPLMVVGWHYTKTDERLVQAVTQFMIASLDGDEGSALEWVTPGQRIDYQRWKKVELEQAFSSIARAGQPTFRLCTRSLGGEMIHVEVQVQGTSERTVKMSQVWRSGTNSPWAFDPVATRHFAESQWASKMARQMTE